MKFIVQKDIIYNMNDENVENINVVEENTISNEININYRRPKFAHRVLANLIDLILAGTASIEDYPAADVNGDGNINVADMTSLIDMLLSSN